MPHAVTNSLKKMLNVPEISLLLTGKSVQIGYKIWKPSIEYEPEVTQIKLTKFNIKLRWDIFDKLLTLWVYHNYLPKQKSYLLSSTSNFEHVPTHSEENESTIQVVELETFTKNLGVNNFCQICLLDLYKRIFSLICFVSWQDLSLFVTCKIIIIIIKK